MLSRRDVDEILTLSCKIIKKLLFSFFYDQKIKNYKNDSPFVMIRIWEFFASFVFGVLNILREQKWCSYFYRFTFFLVLRASYFRF